MSNTFYLSPDNPEMTNTYFARIRSELGSDNKVTVTISDRKEDRSQAQRRLQWKWITQIADFVGEDKSSIRNRLVYRHAVPIFYRDNIVINGVYSADTIDAIRMLKAQGMIEQYQQLMRGFVSSISTNSFTVKQNTEYLEAIFNEATEQSIELFVPRDCDNARFKQ